MVVSNKQQQFEGESWFALGAALGRTKQAVWQKHRDPQDQAPDDEAADE